MSRKKEIAYPVTSSVRDTYRFLHKLLIEIAAGEYPELGLKMVAAARQWRTHERFFAQPNAKEVMHLIAILDRNAPPGFAFDYKRDPASGKDWLGFWEHLTTNPAKAWSVAGLKAGVRSGLTVAEISPTFEHKSGHAEFFGIHTGEFLLSCDDRFQGVTLADVPVLRDFWKRTGLVPNIRAATHAELRILTAQLCAHDLKALR